MQGEEWGEERGKQKKDKQSLQRLHQQGGQEGHYTILVEEEK
jgi:hypothetical protein